MHATTITTMVPERRVLADYLSGSIAAEVAMVTGFAVLIGLSAQVVIPLPFTPVPITGQTFAVLLGGAALGGRRGFAGGLFYLLAGLAGLPWFYGWSSGYAGASFGYILAYPVAAALVGLLASRGLSRRVPGAALAMVAGESLFYLAGIPWLMASAHVGLLRGLELGAFPFLPGDALKLVLAIVCLPVAWSVVGRLRGDRQH